MINRSEADDAEKKNILVGVASRVVGTFYIPCRPPLVLIYCVYYSFMKLNWPKNT